jgi:hypothetical protein
MMLTVRAEPADVRMGIRTDCPGRAPITSHGSINVYQIAEGLASRTRETSNIHPRRTVFFEVLDITLIVDVVTNGGAKPNPCVPGLGAVIRQNRDYACIFGHEGHVSNNNTMGLKAVVSALHLFTESVPVWVSTDGNPFTDGM